MSKKTILTFMSAVLLMVTNPITCNGQSNQKLSETTKTETVENKRVERGDATFYGYHYSSKRKTASGEYFNKDLLTAAHKTLPFGTRVKVTNLKNGKSVIVRINDRGPFIKGRIIDLSVAAAKEIDMIRSGVVPVTVEILGKN